MKKILFSLALMSALLVSCEPENGEDNQEPTPEPEYSISISPAELTFGAEGGEQSVTVTAKYGDDDAQWELYGESDWCEVSTTYGDNGTKVSFTADAYSNTEEARTATYTFVCGDKEAELKIEQEAKFYSISVEPTELTYIAAGEEKEVTVTSSDDWEFSSEEHWISTSQQNGENGFTVKIIVDENPYSEIRIGTATFRCGDKQADVKITQEANEYSISVEPAELIFEVEGGEQTVTVTSSDDWEISEKPDWITLSERYGETGAVITVSAEYNDEADVRSGEIVLSCGDKDAKVSVTQQPDNSPIIQFKDLYFLYALLETYTVEWNNTDYRVDVDKNNDGQISEKEAASVEVLNLEKAEYQSGKDIRNVDELKYFTSLKYLNLSYNEQLTSLDLSKNTALTYLDCGSNELTSLDLSGCTALEYLDCDFNQFTTLDLSKNTALTTLRCNCQLISLDVSNNTALEYLDCSSNPLTSLDLSTALEYLDCGSNELTSLDLSGCTALEYLDCTYNQLTTLDVSGCTALTELNCSDNHQLTSLDLSKNIALETVQCRRNQLTTIDLSGCVALTYLDCWNNQLTTLDVSGCTALKYLECFDNGITDIDLSNNRQLIIFMPVSYEYDYNYNLELGTVNASGGKCPLKSLKIYKYYTTIGQCVFDALDIAYPDLKIEYVE